MLRKNQHVFFLCLLFVSSLAFTSSADRFFVQGIIGTKKDSIVILKDSKNNRIYILKTGDKIPDCEGNCKIDSVDGQKVWIVVNGKKEVINHIWAPKQDAGTAEAPTATEDPQQTSQDLVSPPPTDNLAQDPISSALDTNAEQPTQADPVKPQPTAPAPPKPQGIPLVPQTVDPQIQTDGQDSVEVAPKEAVPKSEVKPKSDAKPPETPAPQEPSD